VFIFVPNKSLIRLSDFKNAIYDTYYGTRDQRVAVLGAFDTWPYIDHVCRQLAEMQLTAITSRYVYKKDPDRGIVTEPHDPEENERMIPFLHSFIERCDRAVVIYSVPAGHYIETYWCQEQKKNTLGIALVRSITLKKRCASLKVFAKQGYSICRGNGTAWDCINKGACPFKEQGMAKNVIEYYLPTKKTPYMHLTALDNLGNAHTLLCRWCDEALLR